MDNVKEMKDSVFGSIAGLSAPQDQRVHYLVVQDNKGYLSEESSWPTSSLNHEEKFVKS